MQRAHAITVHGASQPNGAVQAGLRHAVAQEGHALVGAIGGTRTARRAVHRAVACLAPVPRLAVGIAAAISTRRAQALLGPAARRRRGVGAQAAEAVAVAGARLLIVEDADGARIADRRRGADVAGAASLAGTSTGEGAGGREKDGTKDENRHTQPKSSAFRSCPPMPPGALMSNRRSEPSRPWRTADRSQRRRFGVGVRKSVGFSRLGTQDPHAAPIRDLH